MVWVHSFIHSFIPDIYIAPLQETYSEALSVQLRSKRNVLRSLQKEDMLLINVLRREESALCRHFFEGGRFIWKKSSPLGPSDEAVQAVKIPFARVPPPGR